MELFNDTPFAVTTTVFKSEPKSPLLTIIGKGRFRLIRKGECLALPPEEQEPPLPAEHHEDDYGNSLRRDAEAVPFKPRADCLVSGTCYTPDHEPAHAVAVAIQIGEMQKVLWVYGHRHWKRGASGKYSPSSPEPFVSLPLRNEFAHGGYTSEFNKHGIGLYNGAAADANSKHLPLANIQDDKKSHVTPTEDCIPAGFGPLDPTYRPRRDLGGTYDEEWLYKRKPLPPRDFSFDYFNAARPDQQIEGYLRGDEPLFFENLHAKHRTYKSKLPGIRLRCFLLQFWKSNHGDRLDLLEAPMNLDTCDVDMETETVTLIWRARAPLDPTEHKQYTHALVCVEDLESPQDENLYRSRIKSLILGEAAPSKEPLPVAVPETPIAEAEDAEDGNEAVRAKLADIMKQGKAPPEMIKIVEDNPDPMTALQKLIGHVEKMVADLPKPPK